jgi:hypothetical protein
MCGVTYQAPVRMLLHHNLDEVWVTLVWKWALLRLSPHLAHILNIYFSSPINKYTCYIMFTSGCPWPKATAKPPVWNPGPKVEIPSPENHVLKTISYNFPGLFAWPALPWPPRPALPWPPCLALPCPVCNCCPAPARQTDTFMDAFWIALSDS